ncbi:hypothetical protein H9W91_00020 [Streptomyces alfalfae]|uniref:hypothetical protein n=1 Tax=Streptomyces alfalfae TaxID=1642299 RepID=UPI001BA45B35|nr:hypothetical protein [Streptomyces alfalfae]QUI29460.1 hypothetical protein H9W91_00020 [Streptomyces alfalfae]
MSEQHSTLSGAEDPMGLLHRHHADLVADLGSVLDVEAGLREVLLYADHAQQTATLGKVLDVEAGLAAIVPPLHRADLSAEDPDLLLYAEQEAPDTLFRVDPAVRMRLRRSHVVRRWFGRLKAAEDLHSYVREIVVLTERVHYLLADDSRIIDFSPILQTSLHLSRIAREVYAPSPDNNLEEALQRVPAITSSLEREISQASDAARSLEAVRILNRRNPKNTLHRKSLRDFQQNLTAALGRAKTLSSELTERASTVLRFVLGNEHKYAIALQTCLARKTGAKNFPLLNAEQARDFLDDFTYADLRSADLRGTDMTGVRWSIQTRWPADLDVQDLRARSTEDPPGSGSFIVRSGTARMRACVQLI